MATTPEGGYVTPTPYGAGASTSVTPLVTSDTGLAVTGDVSATDDLTVSDDATVTGDISVGGTAAVTGAATFASTVGVTGILSGFMKTAARTATADGTGTGTIADAGALQLVTVTSADANHIIVLPTPTPGTIVILKNGATGYELRTSAPATISINGGSGANAESAIAAATCAFVICTSATTWQGWSIAGTTLANIEAAA